VVDFYTLISRMSCHSIKMRGCREWPGSAQIALRCITSTEDRPAKVLAGRPGVAAQAVSACSAEL
jgi:hypothetical protein